MNDPRTDLEALRDRWVEEGNVDLYASEAAGYLTAILAAHPAGPDLREALEHCRSGVTSIIARVEELSDSPRSLLQSLTEDLPFMVKTLEEIDAALTAHTEAGEWRGLWRCDKCNRKFLNASDGEHHYPWGTGNRDAFCDGTLRPYERRKGVAK